MEIQRFIDLLKSRLASEKFDLSDDEFFSAMLVGDETFVNHEGDLWDFKETWPFSYSDPYFQSLLKLVVSFANNMGGLVVFNVIDEEKRFKKSKVNSNPDRFMTACHDNINNCPKLDFRELRQGDLVVPVLIVYPKKANELPSNLKEWKGKSKKHWFVREGYECVQASAKKIPTLFCRPQVRGGVSEIFDVSLPPSPSTIRHFVTRFDIIENVFSWLHDEFQPRCFLFGRGGSGKTTIAYEIARYVGKYNSSICDNEYFDLVIFVSAKEKELDVYSGSQREYLGTDFSNKSELFEAILTLSGYYAGDEDSNSVNDLHRDVKELFDTFNVFIVIDDIDTLTTKGEDAGLEDLLLLTARAKKIPKLLYTLRNAPTYALNNSIEVPGLTDEDEIHSFVSECAKQFKVTPPVKKELSDILSVTEGRPLGIESVMALRRSAKNYNSAIKSFEEHAGDNARSYVFEREWNALSPNQRGHNLLVALALAGRALSADELQTILRYDEASVQEAIIETVEMFLEIEEGPSGQTYSLGELTKRFVITQAPNLKLFEQIKARVKTFKSRFHNKPPELIKLILEIDKLMYFARRDGDDAKYNKCWDMISNPCLPEKVKQNPHFMAYAGSVLLKLPNPKIVEAREYFLDAHKNELTIEFEFLEDWHKAECNTASSDEMCSKIVDIILNGRGYREHDRVQICLLESSRLHFRGKEMRFHNTERAIDFLEASLIMHMQNFFRANRCNHLDIDRVHEYARNTALLLFYEIASSRDLVGFTVLVKRIAEVERAYFDPLVQPFVEYGEQIFSSTNSQRIVGPAISSILKLKKKTGSNGLWYEPSYKSELHSIIDDLATNFG